MPMRSTYQNSNGTFSRVAECHVGRVGGPTSASIVHIVGVDHNLLDLSVLTKKVEAPECLLVSYVGSESYHVDQGLLYDP